MAAKTTRKVSRKKILKKDLPMSQGMVLELDGAVYIVERDKDGKEISRVEIPGKSVLKAVLFVLGQMTRNKP